MPSATSSAPPPRLAFGVAGSLALLVLGGLLAWSALDLRARIHAQMIRQDGEILDAVTLLQHLNDQASGEALSSLADPGEQFQLALKISKLRNVLGVRLYAGDGKFLNAVPAYITENALAADDLTELQALRPVSRFFAKARMEEQTLLVESNSATVPLLVVAVPLRAENQGALVGAIQFLLDGSSLARQFAELDRSLLWKFSAAFVVGAGILFAGLGFAFRRVQLANQKLAERTQHLLQANRELALAARTSAVGAVAFHLVHGLKNPLSGLQHFVHERNPANGHADENDWQAALGTTQRMEELINRVARVLQEQQSGASYSLTLAELFGMLAPKADALARAAGVRFECKILCEGNLSNRDADLILLVLENLVQNGIEATTAGKEVAVQVADRAGALIFEVRDQGPGLPPGMAARLFQPCTSGKKGGGGIGLAISKQLAQSLGAKLELAENTAAGCAFRLILPPAVVSPALEDHFSGANSRE
jgi:signal transduction histidine kinase